MIDKITFWGLFIGEDALRVNPDEVEIQLDENLNPLWRSEAL